MRWVLAEAKERIMTEVPANLSRFAEHELRARGIEVRTGTTLREVTKSAATLSDGESVPARTVVWTAGVKPSPAVARLGLPLDPDGRVRVGPTMEVDPAALPAPLAASDGGRPGASHVSATAQRCRTRTAPGSPARPQPSTQSARAAWSRTTSLQPSPASVPARSATAPKAWSPSWVAPRPWR